MSRAQVSRFTCDRCGAVREVDTQHATDAWVRVDFHRLGDADREVCPDCWETFLVWFNEFSDVRVSGVSPREPTP